MKKFLGILQKRILTKKTFFSFLSLLLFLLIPSAFADAISWPWNFGDNLVRWITQATITLLTIVPAVIFFAIAGLLSWGMQITLNVGIVPGNNAVPDFVQHGWEFSRNFVNLFFLLILAFIGLATILRLQEYANKKLIVNLVVIILLMNFSNVLVGLVVDFSNIITHYFFSAIGNFGAGNFNQVFSIGSDYLSTIGSSDELSLLEVFAQGVSYGLVSAVFFLVSALVFWVVFLVLLLRIIVLWLLVILAPFAFAAYILPGTKKYWSQWWQTLIQWSIVGIPIGFFMYIAGQVMDLKTTELFPSSPNIGGEIGNMSQLFTALLAPATGIFLLMIGVGISMAFAPSGSQKLIAWGKDTGRKAAARAGRPLGDTARTWAASRPGFKKFAEKLEQTSSRDAKGIGKFGIRPIAPLARWAGRQLGSENQATLKGQVGTAETAAAKLSAETVASRLRGNISVQEKIGYINAKIKSGDIDDLIKAMGPNGEQEIQKIYSKAKQIGQHKDIEAAMPHAITPTELQDAAVATEKERLMTANPAWPEQQAATQARNTVGPTHIMQERTKRLASMKPDKIRQMSESALNHPDTLNAILRGWDGGQVSALYVQHGFKAVKALEDRLRALTPAGQTPLAWLEDPNGGNNAKLGYYLGNTAGRRLGFTIQ
ncbi:MAG: type IV secretion system protein [Candidatus Wildermuthbacteria bacterium]|nr:type IV secretion system protein [Candidatus Wildermuthbacteria bacterium]